MTQNNKNTNSFGKLNITNKVISYGGQTWPLRNITRVGKYEITNPNPYSIMSMLKTVLGVLLGVFLAVAGYSIGYIIFLAAGIYLYYKYYKNRQNIPFYGLRIETSSGSAELFTSPNENFIDKLVTTISDVIHADEKMDLTVNIDQRTIYDNIHDSTIVQNSDVRDSFNKS